MEKDELDKISDDVELELERIQRSVPEELVNALYVEKEANQTIKKVIRKALDDDEFPEEKKDKYRKLLKSGKLDGTIEVLDEDAVDEYAEYMEKEIKKSIEAGRLPDRDSDVYQELIKTKRKDD